MRRGGPGPTSAPPPLLSRVAKPPTKKKKTCVERAHFVFPCAYLREKERKPPPPAQVGGKYPTGSERPLSGGAPRWRRSGSEPPAPPRRPPRPAAIHGFGDRLRGRAGAAPGEGRKGSSARARARAGRPLKKRSARSRSPCRRPKAPFRQQQQQPRQQPATTKKSSALSYRGQWAQHPPPTRGARDPRGLSFSPRALRFTSPAP